MALTLTGALAPLAKVQTNPAKSVKLEAELVSAKETFETVERRLNSANDTINAELAQDTAVIENLGKLLGK